VAAGLVRELGRILRACRELPVPQKWVGSSVALVAEAGAAAARPQSGAPASALGHPFRVVLFDWGRSELNTPASQEALSAEGRQDREEYWALYQVGLGRLYWEAARFYWNDYCAAEWSRMRITVYDYDSQTKDDLLGIAEVALPAGEGREALKLPLQNEQGGPVKGKNGFAAEVKIEVSFATYPAPSRLRGAWRVRVCAATHLPAGDVGITASSSDPFAVVALLEPPGANGGGRRAQALTAVVAATLNPEWNEDFEFPVVQAEDTQVKAQDDSLAGEAALLAALGSGLGPLGPGDLPGLLPAPRELGSSGEVTEEEHRCLGAFLKQTCGS